MFIRWDSLSQIQKFYESPTSKIRTHIVKAYGTYLGIIIHNAQSTGTNKDSLHRYRARQSQTDDSRHDPTALIPQDRNVTAAGRYLGISSSCRIQSSHPQPGVDSGGHCDLEYCITALHHSCLCCGSSGLWYNNMNINDPFTLFQYSRMITVPHLSLLAHCCLCCELLRLASVTANWLRWPQRAHGSAAGCSSRSGSVL